MTAIKELRSFLEEVRQNYENQVSSIEHSIEYENLEGNRKKRALQLIEKYDSIIEVIKRIEFELLELAKKDLENIQIAVDNIDKNEDWDCKLGFEYARDIKLFQKKTSKKLSRKVGYLSLRSH